jgi:tetratricopeptide (TPR) repeat protein
MHFFQKVTPPNQNSQIEKMAYYSIADKTFRTPLLSTDYKIQIAFNITNTGMVDQGIRYFQEILKSDPRRHDAAEFLATLYEHDKNYPVAIKYRLEAAKLDPHGAPSLIELEKDYLAVNEAPAARRTRDTIVAMAPNTDVAAKAGALFVR